jgi:hypothetical protein
MNKSRYFLAVIFVAAGQLTLAQQPVSSSPLGFTSSIPWLTQSFTWAKSQALAYGRAGSKMMGPWYEAALPGRNAFCMRDVSHQTGGAAALGMYAANLNMLSLFTQSAAESRDWAAFWEIDGDGQPSSADYVSDDDFWFNLPANFDVLDASVRMWRWTGDETYHNNPTFQRFFRATMREYVQAWQLAPDKILSRPRIANQRLAEGRFVHSRGIPSYTEGTKDFIFGTDLLAAEYRAIRSFSEIADKSNKALAQTMQSEADAIQSLLERVGWSDEDHQYFGTIQKDQRGSGSGNTLVLYYGAAKDPAHIRGALDYISSSTYWKQINIEEESYVPLTLFRYGRNEAAYQVLTDLSSPQKNRREYPEVSYALIEAIVSGVIGLSPGPIGGGDYDVSTISRLPKDHDQASLTGVSIRGNQLEVTQTGTSATQLKNISGPVLRWRAEFPGTLPHLKIDGKNISAQHSTTAEGLAISWTDVTVVSGSSVMVSK